MLINKILIPIYPSVLMDIYSLREKWLIPSMLFMDMDSLRETRAS